jgi:Diphthamide synthase
LSPVRRTEEARASQGKSDDRLVVDDSKAVYSSGRGLAGLEHGALSALAAPLSEVPNLAALLTTVTESYDRISMHGVRRALLEQQAAALGLPLDVVLIPPACGNDVYEERMRSALARHRAAGVSRVVCGDIFLADVRRYREERLFREGLSGIFPLWQRDSRELARRFLGLGFRAVLCCVDARVLYSTRPRLTQARSASEGDRPRSLGGCLARKTSPTRKRGTVGVHSDGLWRGQQPPSASQESRPCRRLLGRQGSACLLRGKRRCDLGLDGPLAGASGLCHSRPRRV